MESEDSSGLLLWLPLPPRSDTTPSVLRRLQVEGDEIRAESQGSYQSACSPTEIGLVNYGQIPLFREFDSSTGGLERGARFGCRNAQSYGVFRKEWQALPDAWGPRQVTGRLASDDGITVGGYVSWNGAMDVATWRLYAMSSEDRPLGVVHKKGFEMTFVVQLREDGCLVAVAVVDGKAMRRFNIVSLT